MPQWFIGDEHGLVHDGLQGDGYIQLRLDWKVTNPETQVVTAHSAMLRANPWLSYACAEGARLAMRRPDQTEGKCATVQRTLRDDSVVVRVDGMFGETTVDPSPLTVVRTTNPRHEPGTRLLYLHEGACVDAVVENWAEEKLDVKEGSRHRLRAAAATVTGWISCVSGGKEGEPERENLRATAMPGAEEVEPEPEEGEPTEKYYSVIAQRPMLVRAGCEKDSGFVGHLNPGTMVRVLEFRDASDGTKRAFVDSMAGDEQYIIAALNEFNHSVQRFATAAEYEGARANYCEDMVEREAMVEDAITGNLLRIKDQTLHVSTATDGLDNYAVPAEWRVNDVRDLVALFLTPSPNRSMGAHSEQPVLVRAGPGTGKTWMTKQAVFTLADNLRVATGQKDGVRLVPMVVYVQRIVYLLRENGDGPSHLLSRYIESVYAGRKYDSWREMLMQAYEMRALIVLLDGVDEAAGLRDEIETFVHKELVPSGVRVLVTSRPEGVSVPVYAVRFVVMNLCELTNEQQRRVINVQMQGSQFFDHLLSLGESRKGLDEAFSKLKESTRVELENLFVASRFKSEADGSWLPEMRQTEVTGQRFVAAAEEKSKPESLYLQQLDRELRAFTPQRCGIDLLSRVDSVLNQSTFLTPDNEFQEKILEDMLGPDGELELRHRVAVRLGLMMQKKRHTAQLHSNAQEGKREKEKEKEEKKAAATANLKAEEVWVRVVSRTDELYVVAEQMYAVFEFVVEEFAAQASESEDGSKAPPEVLLADLKDPVRVYEKGSEELASRFPDDVLGEACVSDVLRCRINASSGSQVLDVVNALIDGAAFEIEAHTFPMWRHERAKMEADLAAKREAAAAEAGEELAPGGGASTQPTRAVDKSDPLWIRNFEVDIDTDKILLKELGIRRPGVPVPPENATLEILALFNKFADLDPTHFRCAICTMQLTYRGLSIFCEVEVHYSEIMRIALGGGEVVQAMEHYNFFRRRLAGQVAEDELDALLEGKLVFLVDATGIPVLLSLLVLIFTSGGEDLTKLPSNRIELYELGIESAINKRLSPGGKNVEVLIRDWMRLFNLDRGASVAAAQDTAAGGKGGAAAAAAAAGPSAEDLEAKKREREHKPTRKAQMKFEDLRMDEHSSKKMAEQNQGDKGEKANAQVFKLTSQEVYEVFKHGSHYLREAVKPEVQRTELNRIELLMPKKLVDTVMMLVNANLKLLLGGRAHMCGLSMLRNVAVTNQQAGRREFSSAHVADALLLVLPNAEAFTLWLHLNKEDGGLPLIKTLEVQTEAAPAQYQFKHLSFQEGLFAQHLLNQAEEGWEGWATDEDAAKFLNNPFMNNTCRIAAGHLGSRLARRKPVWDFTTHTLSTVGLTALWLILEHNEKITTLLLDGNGVGARAEDSVGLGRAMVTAPSLRKLSLSKNNLGDLKNEMRKFARGLSSNSTLTHLNVANNNLGPEGIKIMCNALKTCLSLKVLDISYNTPGREAALAELFRAHQVLESVGVVEKEPTTRMERTFHLDARAKEAIGRALLASKTHQIRFVQCDVFALTSKVTSLVWKTSSASDAVMLAGVLRSNNILTALTMGPGGELNEGDREEIGRALLANRAGKVGYCDLFGLVEGMKPNATFDLRDKDQVRSLRSFTLLAGLLRANDTLKQLTMKSLAAEHVSVLCEALRGNTTLETLRLEHPTRGNDMTVTNLPVQQLNGNLQLEAIDLWKAGENHVNGEKLPMHVSPLASYTERTRVACCVWRAACGVRRAACSLPGRTLLTMRLRPTMRHRLSFLPDRSIAGHARVSALCSPRTRRLQSFASTPAQAATVVES